MTMSRCVPSGKRRFRDESRALIAAWKLEAIGVPVTIYKCPHCKGIHLTRSKPNRRGGSLKQAERLAGMKHGADAPKEET